MKTIEQLALEACIREVRFMTNPPRPTGTVLCNAESLARFAALVAEQCAQIATGPAVGRSWPLDGPATAECAAAAIRAAFPMPRT